MTRYSTCFHTFIRGPKKGTMCNKNCAKGRTRCRIHSDRVAKKAKEFVTIQKSITDDTLNECSTCEITKPMKEFYKDKRRVKGYTTQCKECIRATVTRTRADRREKRRVDKIEADIIDLSKRFIDCVDKRSKCKELYHTIVTPLHTITTEMKTLIEQRESKPKEEMIEEVEEMIEEIIEEDDEMDTAFKEYIESRKKQANLPQRMCHDLTEYFLDLKNKSNAHKTT